MADTKISALPAAGSVADANEFAINEAGTSKKVTAAQIATHAAAAHLADASDAHDASAISVVDAPGWYAGTEVEAVLSESAANVSTLWVAILGHIAKTTIYEPGSITIPNGEFAIMSKRLQLTAAERYTLQGTAQLRIV